MCSMQPTVSVSITSSIIVWRPRCICHIITDFLFSTSPLHNSYAIWHTNANDNHGIITIYVRLVPYITRRRHFHNRDKTSSKSIFPSSSLIYNGDHLVEHFFSVAACPPQHRPPAFLSANRIAHLLNILLQRQAHRWKARAQGFPTVCFATESKGVSDHH